MNKTPSPVWLRNYILFCLAVICLISGVHAYSDTTFAEPKPAVYLNFDEGSGIYVFDASGNGNAGTLHGVTRFEDGICGQAAFFNGTNNFVEIPFSSQNHPSEQITVSLWFYTDSFEPQVLVSTYEDGGYRLGFDDGGDLWWTVNLERKGDVSVPVQHENIALHQWHQVTGTYDGQRLKLFLDGILRNQLNTTGAIHYQYSNYVTLGADAGLDNRTDPSCPQYFHGGLDEIRIYPIALTYEQVMNNRYQCSSEPVTQPRDFLKRVQVPDSCAVTSGSVNLSANEVVLRVLSFPDKTENGTWKVTLPPGSTLVVNGRDLYSVSYPDAWYIEIGDEKGRITRSIAFPNRNNAPVQGVIPSGNASVLVRYFDGKGRFPAQVAIQFESITPKPPANPRPIILNYPVIVFYSASWVTLIAIILVMVLLHLRKNKKKK
jgi:hypothetical protein